MDKETIRGATPPLPRPPEDRPPRGLKNLGYRQKAVLALLQETNRTLPTGYLKRCVGIEDPKVIDSALRGLQSRGLAVHVGHGKWAAA